MQAFHNTPSAGYIAWQDVHIQYKGTTYNIPNGNTDKRFVIWRYADPDCFYGSDEFPTLGPEDLLVFLNKNGTYAIVPKTQIVDGSLIVSDSIMTDAIAANAITTAKIAAGAITADLIAANAIGAGAIAAGAVTADKIAAGEIATTHLAALAVTADKIAANSVTADKVAANAIGAEKIAAGAITAEKLSIGVAEGMTGPIDADDRPISALSSQITLDEDGLAMKPAGASNNAMLLDSKRLEFRDSNNARSIAVGDVAGLPDTAGMQYGLLMRHGRIHAEQAVDSYSLTDGGTTTAKLANGGVTIAKLSGDLSVTIPDRFQLHTGKSLEGENKLTNPGFETGSLTGWTGTGTVVSSTVHSGSYAVNKANIYQDTPASSGQVWVGQAWVRGHGTGGQEYVTLQFLNASKTVLSTSKSPTGPLAWTQLRVVGVAPANTAYARLLIKSVGTDTTHRFDDCLLAQGGVSSAYVTFASATISKTETCEQIKVNTEIDNLNGATIYTRVLVNGTTKLETSSAVATVMASLTLDARSIAGDITVQVQAKTSGSGAAWTKAEILANQRLPLRGASPRYAVTSSTESSCGTTCEAACQATCQLTCQDSCQSTCQNSCQSTCQSTCEQTSQGGGCWVAGTLVTVYDQEKDVSCDIPVEQLEPGMIMPWYNVAADTIELTECVSNTRTWTHTIYEIEIEGGYRLEATGEQPLDVLRGSRWFKLPARDIQASDRLVRPFDGTLHEVQSVKRTVRARTWVYNPKTTSGSYIANGFSDMAKAN